MAGDKGPRDGRPAPIMPARTEGVEQRIDRWATMLDEAVALLNQVMTEVKETGKTEHDDE